MKTKYEDELIKAIAIIDYFPSEVLGYVNEELKEVHATYKAKEKELKGILAYIEIYKRRAANFESFAEQKQKVINRLNLEIQEKERKLKVLSGKIEKQEQFLKEYGVCCDAIRHHEYLEKRKEKRIEKKKTGLKRKRKS